MIRPDAGPEHVSTVAARVLHRAGYPELGRIAAGDDDPPDPPEPDRRDPVDRPRTTQEAA
jgi:hypothetical protein